MGLGAAGCGMVERWASARGVLLWAEGLCMDEAQWRMRDTPGGRVAEGETQVSQVR